MGSIKCALVMPAYNEQDCIEGVVHSWAKELGKVVGGDFKLIVVNDGSRDKTGEILDRMLPKNPHLIVFHKPNGGHGSSVIAGYQKAVELGAEYIFQTDSDDQFVTEDFRRLWDMRAESHFVLGRRLNRHDPLHRIVITRILRFLVYMVFGEWIKDSNIPFRLIQGGYLKAQLAELPTEVFAPNIFLSVLARREGQKTFDIPITHRERQTGTVSIVRWKLIKVCLRTAQELVKFRMTLGTRTARIRKKMETAKLTSVAEDPPVRAVANG